VKADRYFTKSTVELALCCFLVSFLVSLARAGTCWRQPSRVHGNLRVENAICRAITVLARGQTTISESVSSEFDLIDQTQVGPSWRAAEFPSPCPLGTWHYESIRQDVWGMAHPESIRNYRGAPHRREANVAIAIASGCGWPEPPSRSSGMSPQSRVRLPSRDGTPLRLRVAGENANQSGTAWGWLTNRSATAW